MTRLKQQRIFSDARGDTIIEVLIAISIVSLVLTSSYALTNRNAQVNQKIQEQGQAQRLVERQIELLRGYNGTVNGTCLVAAGAVVSEGTTATCKVSAEASSALYTLTILDKGSSLYEVSASWDALGGQNGNVTMYYRR